MTPSGAQALHPIIKAYSEGARIQYFDENRVWADIPQSVIYFTDDASRYRIKPEIKHVSLTVSVHVEGEKTPRISHSVGALNGDTRYSLFQPIEIGHRTLTGFFLSPEIR